MERYEIRLRSPDQRGVRISASALLNLLRVLADGSMKAVRLAVEGTSGSKGPIPAWLKDAAHLDVVGLKTGSTILELEAPALKDASPARLGQGDLFRVIDVDQSCVGLFVEGLSDALRGDAESDRYDDGLIGVYEDLASLGAEGVEEIDVAGAQRVHVAPDGLARISDLRRKMPGARRVRVSGKVDQIRHSDRMFSLLLSDRQTLRGIAGEVEPETLRKFWGKEAIVGGRAIFRVSGRVLRIEADSIEPADATSTIWSAVPAPLEAEIDRRVLEQPQGPRSGINAVFGQWPGDESEETISRAMEEIS